LEPYFQSYELCHRWGAPRLHDDPCPCSCLRQVRGVLLVWASVIVIVTVIVIVIPQLTQFIVVDLLEPDEYSYHTRMILVGGT
jgi:hypothetical protein